MKLELAFLLLLLAIDGVVWASIGRPEVAAVWFLAMPGMALLERWRSQ